MLKDDSNDCSVEDVMVEKNDKDFIYVSMGDEAAKELASYRIEGSTCSSFNVAIEDPYVDSLLNFIFLMRFVIMSFHA